MIELSVGIPMFRAKYSAWIALESLVRQEGIDFSWELIIAEETFHESFGINNVNKYRDKLKKVGCKRIKYIPLGIWKPLSDKFEIMVKNCSTGSNIYASNSADLYAPPRRLKTQYDIMTNNSYIDWCASGKTIVYDIKTEKTYLNDSSLAKTINDASCRSMRMEIMRNFKVKGKRKGLDGTIFKFAKEYVESKGKDFHPYVDHVTDNWKYGLNTNGLNNITIYGLREKRFKGENRPPNIIDCPFDIHDTIPKEIMTKLKKVKRYLHLHNRTGIKML